MKAAGWLAGARALELGGPSEVFGARGVFPVYPRLAVLDILDFAEDTLWSVAQSALVLPPGERKIGEAGDLSNLADGTYDAILASHVIEHIADGLTALREWRRVVKPQGFVVLVVPHREGTFDHRRPVTTLAHLQEDAERATSEDDLSHLEEVVTLHDLSRDPGAPDRTAFIERCRRNPEIRGMHHHVFVTRSVADLCRAAGLEVLLLRALLPFHILAVCRPAGDPAAGIGEQALARALAASPFISDRSTQRGVPDSRHASELLDSIPGAYDRAQLGRRQANAGETISLNEL